jgi:hypothetical protein
MQQITQIKYVIQHFEGYFINLKYEAVKDFKHAYRFYSEEDALQFLTQSYYKTTNPELYHIVPIKITYELEDDPHVQQKRDDIEACGSAS